MNYLVAGFLWLLVVALSLRARFRADNTMLKAAVVIAASLTTNIDGVYLWMAENLPWPNVLDLVSNILLIVGVYYLSRAIARGARGVGEAATTRGEQQIRRAAAATIAVMAVSFTFIEDPEPSTTFMLEYGGQPAAGLYSGIQYLYIFAVMTGTLVTCVRNVPQMRRMRFRAGFRIIGFGAGAAILLSAAVIVMDVAHVVGAEPLMRAVGMVYDVLSPVAVLLLSAGLAVPPLGRVLSELNLRRSVSAIEPQLKELWLATAAKAPAVSLVGTTAQSGAGGAGKTVRGATEAIHRLVIEIHDWANVHGSTTAQLSAENRAVLSRAEALCLKQGEGL